MVAEKIDEIVETFQMVEPETRLELLLDYSKRLPELPERYRAERDAGLHRVPECMTPVFLWVEKRDGALDLHIDVAEEAPTVKGVLAILYDALQGAPPDEARDVPGDLINRLGLADYLRMNRAIGLAAILGRIKREAARVAGDDA